MSIINFKTALFFYVVYFLCIPFLLAQSSSIESIYDTIYTKRKIKLVRKEVTPSNYKRGDIGIYVSPVAIIEPRPTIYLGGEYFVKDRMSVYTEFGYTINLLGLTLNTETNPAVAAQEDQVNQTILNSSKANYVLKPEIRWYRDGNNPRDAAYYGFRLMWRNMNYLKNQRTFEEYAFSTLTDNWTGIGQESISIYPIRRRSMGVQFLLGWKNSLFKIISSNLYMGVGVRYISNVPKNKIFDPFEQLDATLNDLDLDFLSFNKQYKFVTMDFAFGMRFGGRIKQR